MSLVTCHLGRFQARSHEGSLRERGEGEEKERLIRRDGDLYHHDLDLDLDLDQKGYNRIVIVVNAK